MQMNRIIFAVWQYFEFMLHRNHFPICWVHVCWVHLKTGFLCSSARKSLSNCPQKIHHSHKLWKVGSKWRWHTKTTLWLWSNPKPVYFIASLNIFLLPYRFGHWQLWGLMAAFARSAIGLQILATGPFVCFSARCRPNLEEALKLAKKKMDYRP